MARKIQIRETGRTLIPRGTYNFSSSMVVFDNEMHQRKESELKMRNTFKKGIGFFIVVLLIMSISFINADSCLNQKKGLWRNGCQGNTDPVSGKQLAAGNRQYSTLLFKSNSGFERNSNNQTDSLIQLQRSMASKKSCSTLESIGIETNSIMSGKNGLFRLYLKPITSFNLTDNILNISEIKTTDIQNRENQKNILGINSGIEIINGLEWFYGFIVNCLSNENVFNLFKLILLALQGSYLCILLNKFELALEINNHIFDDWNSKGAIYYGEN